MKVTNYDNVEYNVEGVVQSYDHKTGTGRTTTDLKLTKDLVGMELAHGDKIRFDLLTPEIGSPKVTNVILIEKATNTLI